MPQFGIGAIAEGWLKRWEAAQAARYSAWSSAPSVVAGVTAVAVTAGAMVKGSTSGGAPSFAAAVQRFASGHPAGSLFGATGSSSYTGHGIGILGGVQGSAGYHFR